MPKNETPIIEISAQTKALMKLLGAELPEDLAVVSIRNFQDGVPIDATRERLLVLCFDDTIEDLPNAMSVAQAEAIARFARAHRGRVGTLLIHCHAGMSRSPAVAAAIRRGFGWSDLSIWRDPAFRPNTLCYRRVLRAFGVWPALVKYRSSLNRRAFSKRRK